MIVSYQNVDVLRGDLIEPMKNDYHETPGTEIIENEAKMHFSHQAHCQKR